MRGRENSQEKATGGVRDRGKPGTLRMRAADDRIYVDRGEGYLTPEKPTTNPHPLDDDRILLEVKAGNRKQLLQGLERARTQHPDLDVAAAMSLAERGYHPVNEFLTVTLEIGATVEFPAAFVAASLFALHHGFAPHPGFTDYVECLRQGQGEHPPLPPDTFYWHHGPDPWKVTAATVPHVVVLHASAARKAMIVSLAYFNASCIAVTLPFQGETDEWRTHGVDVLTGKKADVVPDRGAFASRPWSASHAPEGPDDLGERITRVVDASRPHKRAQCLIAAAERHRRGRTKSQMSEEEIAAMYSEVDEILAAMVEGRLGPHRA